MELRMEFKGVEGATRYLEGVKRRIKSEPTKITQRMASAFRQRVKAKIPRNVSGVSPGHSTPTSLLQLLAPVDRLAGGHVVRFRRNAEFARLPEVINYGASPHDMYKNKKPVFGFIDGPVMHPGTKPTNFWEIAFEEFRAKDVKKISEDGLRRIVKK